MSDLVRLRYTGSHATTFTGIGHVTVNGEFEVPEDEAEPFLRRGDIERAGVEPVASEESSASQEADTSGGGPSGRRGRSGSRGMKDVGEQ